MPSTLKINKNAPKQLKFPNFYFDFDSRKWSLKVFGINCNQWLDLKLTILGSLFCSLILSVLEQQEQVQKRDSSTKSKPTFKFKITYFYWSNTLRNNCSPKHLLVFSFYHFQQSIPFIKIARIKQDPLLQFSFLSVALSC